MLRCPWANLEACGTGEVIVLALLATGEGLAPALLAVDAPADPP